MKKTTKKPKKKAEKSINVGESVLKGAEEALLSAKFTQSRKKLPVVSGDVIAFIASWAIIVGTAVLFYNVFG